MERISPIHTFGTNDREDAATENCPLPEASLGIRIGTVVVYIVLLSGCALSAELHEPIKSASLRATPLSFGMHVSPDPQENPINPPERFEGYHTGVDYEVTEDELRGDVPIFAICSGSVVYSGFVEGYGGLLAQQCSIGGEPVEVLYGHLLVDPLPKVGTRPSAGEQIGLLASAKSVESDQNRKHLHLSIHRGNTPEYRGYVQNPNELSEYINPQTLFPPSISGTPLQPYWKTVPRA